MVSSFFLLSTLCWLAVRGCCSWFFIWLGLKWAKVEQVTWRRVLGISVLVISLQTLVYIVVRSVLNIFSAGVMLTSGVVLIVASLLACVLIRIVFSAGWLQSLKASVPTILVEPLILVGAMLTVFPFAYEAFVVNANSMSPTILGKHRQIPCPQCGGPAFASPPLSSYEDRSAEPTDWICQDHFHVTNISAPAAKHGGPDRFIVAKYQTPKRWDLIVFQYPEDPSRTYVKRLVGLPGEEVIIREGKVWIDGEALTPPASIREIEYLAEMPHQYEPLWGSPERPAQLADDEYFVLGDFSARSMDSRLWRAGAEGHHPYAVPESHLKGVAERTYWPPSRWRDLRPGE